MKNYRLSIFDNTYDKIGKETSIENELSSIKNGLYKSEISNCRRAYSSNSLEYKKLKSKLKAVTFCGMFSQGRKLSNLIHYNSLIVIDIDNLTRDELNKVKELLKNDPYIMALWDSPSGLGLKGLVRVNSTIDLHKKYFTSLSIYFLQQYAVELDKSGSDITRLCYVSWDENIYINKSSNIFSDLLEFEFEEKEGDNTREKNKKTERPNISLSKSAFATEGLNNPSSKRQMKKIISYLKSNNFSITNEYTKWIKVAVAISNTFSFDVGEEYYLKLCRLDHEAHDEYKSKELIKYCYNNRNINYKERVLFGTIIYEANKVGFKIRK